MSAKHSTSVHPKFLSVAFFEKLFLGFGIQTHAFISFVIAFVEAVDITASVVGAVVFKGGDGYIIPFRGVSFAGGFTFLEACFISVGIGVAVDGVASLISVDKALVISAVVFGFGL